MDDNSISTVSNPKPLFLRILMSIFAVAVVVGLFAGILVGTEWLFRLAIKPVTQSFVYGTLGFATDSPRGMALSFFIAIMSKVLILLACLIYLVGYVRTYFSPERTRAILTGKPLFVGNILAALLGIVTPFCTCSAIALFIGFIEAGIPLGVTLSFLISAPMINEIAIGLLANSFGNQIAAMYIGCGLVIAIVSGWILGKFNPRNFVEDWVYDIQINKQAGVSQDMSVKERLASAWDSLKDIMGRIWAFVAIGIGVAAAIYGGVPDDTFGSVLGGSNWWSVPLAVLIGVPMYGNAGGAVPIMQVLLQKGAAMGTSLAFIMAMTGLSLPEMIVLRKVMKLKMIFIFAGVVSLGILIVGYMFNYILR